MGGRRLWSGEGYDGHFLLMFVFEMLLLTWDLGDERASFMRTKSVYKGVSSKLFAVAKYELYGLILSQAKTKNKQNKKRSI